MKRMVCVFLLSVLSGCLTAPQPIPSTAQNPAEKSAAESAAGIGLKKASDAKQLFDQMPANIGIEARAKDISEVDEWLFDPAEEKQSIQMIEYQISVLRDQIEREIGVLLKTALNATDGKTATAQMLTVNQYLNLYPAPMNVEQRAKLEKITTSIMSTSRRVEDIRHLRYNEWAITQIETGLAKYYEVKGIFITDKEALIKACIDSMKAIDPAYLDPAVLDLYSYVLGLTREAVSPTQKIELAKGFADPSTIRKMPSDF